MAKKKVFAISSSLTDGIEETFAAAANYSGELRYDVIPLKKIEVDPENPRDLIIGFEDVVSGIAENDPNIIRKKQELESLKTISHSIKTQGLLNPIVVYKYGEKYRLIAGERRTLASLMAEKNDIQAKILDTKPDSLKIRLLQWIENVERSDLSLWERISNLQLIALEYARKNNKAIAQINIKELCELIGCAKSQADKYKNLLMVDETIIDLIKNNKIKNLDKAAFIASIQDKQIRTVVIEACLKGMPITKLKFLAEEKNHKPATIITRNKPGRERVRVDFGATKNINVAKLVVESLMSNPSLAHITDSINVVELNSYQAISDAFKLILERLEKVNA